MPDYHETAIPYGVKLIFDDGTVVNWYREARRRTVFAEKNPRGLRFPPSATSIDEIIRVITGEAEPITAPDGLPSGAFDGGADPNPGPGGWGVVLPDGRELCGGEPLTTNNRMELTGAIRLLEETSGPLRAIGDSHYVIAGITRWIHTWRVRGWKTVAGQPVDNRDLWERLGSLTEGREVTWVRVKGHAGHPLNERCDRLSQAGRVAAMRAARRSRTTRRATPASNG